MSPFLSIWIKPLETFKFLEQRKLAGKENYIEFLFALISLSACLANIKDIPNLFDSKLFTFFFTIIIAPLFGLLFSLMLSYFFWRLGKILKGKASLAEIQLVLAYSLIPHLLNLIIVLIFLIPALQMGNLNMIFHQHPITYIVIGLLVIRNLIYGLSYFNKFSYGYAVLNIFIIGAIFEAINLLIKH